MWGILYQLVVSFFSSAGETFFLRLWCLLHPIMKLSSSKRETSFHSLWCLIFQPEKRLRFFVFSFLQRGREYCLISTCSRVNFYVDLNRSVGQIQRADNLQGHARIKGKKTSSESAVQIFKLIGIFSFSKHNNRFLHTVAPEHGCLAINPLITLVWHCVSIVGIGSYLAENSKSVK